MNDRIMCDETWPTNPTYTCTKAKPCYHQHIHQVWDPVGAELVVKASWPNPNTPPVKDPKRTKKMKEMAGNAKPAKRIQEILDAPDVALPRNPTDTQVATAARVLPHTGTQRRIIYDTLLDAGEDGYTDEELQMTLSLNPSTVRPRRGELVEAGLAKDSGRRRRVASGDQAIVWVTT